MTINSYSKKIEYLVLLGSKTAKEGFKNEDDIVNKFNNWNSDEEAQTWLSIMGYSLTEIEKVVAVKLHGFKTDVQVQITVFFKKAVSAENLSVKLVSNTKGFNQVDKRWVSKYVEMWNIPEEVSRLLRLFTGEDVPYKNNVRDKRRMFLDELSEDEQQLLLRFFIKNKILILTDILKGRGIFSAGWMLVAMKAENNSQWILKSINHALNIFGNGDIVITPRGSLRIGRITMQRKGGDGGRETAKMLQFKIDPLDLFLD